MATQPRGGAFPDATAVSLADGEADGCAKEVCPVGGTAGIYELILAYKALVKNREILRTL